MYTEKGKRKVHGFLQFLIIGSGILLTSVAARAADIEWSGQAKAIGSNNIRRATPDLEREGSLLAIDTTLILKDSKGRASYTLLGKGGWETLEDGVEEAQTDEIYLLRGTAQIPLGVDATLDGSVESSRETEDPEPTDLLQERFTTTRDRGQLSATWRPTTHSEWRARAMSTAERRKDPETGDERETEEVEAGLSSTFPAWRRASLSLEAAGADGSERFTGDTWTKRSAALSLAMQSGRLMSGTLKIDWEGSDLDRGVTGETESSDRYGAAYSYGFSLAEGWTLTQVLGVDGLKSGAEPVQWEGRLEVTISDALASTSRAQVTMYTRPFLENPAEGEVRITRETGAQASMDWRAARSLTITPFFLYRVNDAIEGESSVDRYTDSIARLRAAWVFPKKWTISLTGASETRDSTPDTLDLYENRLELVVSGVFF